MPEAAHGAVEAWTPDHYRGLVPWPDPTANKYSRGQAVIAAGSARFPGAAVLSARGAQYGGAGYVLLCTPRACVAAAQAHLTCVPVAACAESRGAFSASAAAEVLEHASRAGALVVGPGITVTDGTKGFLSTLIERCEMPLLLDADALTLAGDLREQLTARAQGGRLTVLTPHEGEARRLLAPLGAANLLEETPASRLQRYNAAVTLSRGYAATVVLKGPATLIAAADGRRVVENPSGSAALATAGTGDVLAGMLGAHWATGKESFAAACSAVYQHGRLADRWPADQALVASALSKASNFD